MEYTMLSQKIDAQIVALAKQVMAEGDLVKDHLKRLKVMRGMVSNEPEFSRFMQAELYAQDLSLSSDDSDIKSKMAAILDDLVALGFGD